MKGRTQQANAIDASYKRAGFKEVLRTRIQIGGDSSTQDYAPWAVAESYALLGEKDQAFVWLNKEYDVRSGLVFLKADPVWDNIRSDPRFQELLHRIGLLLNQPLERDRRLVTADAMSYPRAPEFRS